MCSPLSISFSEPAILCRGTRGSGNSWEICQRCAKILLAAEHKMQLAYYLRNTDWFQRCSEFGFFDEPFIILFTIFY